MATVFCPKCETTFSIADDTATRSAACLCGNVVDLPTPPPIHEPAPFSFDDGDQPDDSDASLGPRSIWRSRGKPLADCYGIMSFTFSLTGILVCFIGGIWFSLAAGIAAIVVGILSLRHHGRWWGIAGLFVGGLLVTLATLVIGLAAAKALRG